MHRPKESTLSKLSKFSLSIVSSPDILEELIEEINENTKGPISGMFKAFFKKPLLNEIGMHDEVLGIMFLLSTITEIPLYHSSELGMKCFFMPKGSIFPLHDHPNRAICTGVLYGEIKYLSLNQGTDSWCRLSKKGRAKASDVLFCTLKNKNIHSLFAVQDSVILDIFMPNYSDEDDFDFFHVVKKRKREFLLEKRCMTHQKVEASSS